MLALLALLLLLAWWLWPAPELPPPPPPVAEAPAPAPRAPARKAPPAKKKPPVAQAPPAPAATSQRALLMKAVEARAPQLRDCPLPPGSPGRVAARLRIAQAGPTRSVSFSTPQPLPPALRDCLTQRIVAWDFADVQLTSDAEVLVNFTLGS